MYFLPLLSLTQYFDFTFFFLFLLHNRISVYLFGINFTESALKKDHPTWSPSRWILFSELRAFNWNKNAISHAFLRLEKRVNKLITNNKYDDNEGESNMCLLQIFFLFLFLINFGFSHVLFYIHKIDSSKTHPFYS